VLRETKELSSISEESTTFREFQGFIEGRYFQRPGSERLAAAPPVSAGSGTHLIDAVRIAQEVPRARTA
jgi:hypothetical protein